MPKQPSYLAPKQNQIGLLTIPEYGSLLAREVRALDDAPDAFFDGYELNLYCLCLLVQRALPEYTYEQATDGDWTGVTESGEYEPEIADALDTLYERERTRKAEVKPTTIKIRGLEVPKYGRLKFSEIRQNYLAGRAMAATIPDKMTDTERATNLLRARRTATEQLATIALARIVPGWTQVQTIADLWTLPVNGVESTFPPTFELLEDLSAFIENEAKRWPKGEPQPKKPSRKRRTGKGSGFKSAK
ncbi:MAG: hypothetical protein AAFQ99_05820 [Pseudomonadota bacterium]